MQLQKNHDTRTLILPAPKDDLLRVMLSMTHQSKNLFNICNWLVRQVVSAYEYDRVEKVSRRKSVLHPNQIEAIAHFNSQIDEINRKRAKNHPAKVEKARLAHEAEAAGEKGEAKEFEPPKLKLPESAFYSAFDIHKSR